jgi:hypothetical protein
MECEEARPEVREGVRSGIFSAIKHDVERRGGRTARLLGVAGLIGVLGAIGVTLLVSRHPFTHHPPWHMAAFGAIWAGLLVVSFAIALLKVRTPTLPLSRAASIGILGLGLAGICGAACPDQHFLHWWSTTGIGAPVTQAGGAALGALCFGAVTTLFVGSLAAFLLLGDTERPIEPFLPAAALVILLVPGLVLQSIGTSFGVFAGWLGGTAAGAYLGVAAGSQARALLSRSRVG